MTSDPDLSAANPDRDARDARRAGLVVLSEEPLNCEVPPALLADEVTPTSKFFRRNHFPIPELDASTWRLGVGGLVRRRLSLSRAELVNRDQASTAAVLECAGNGRQLFRPATGGEPWGLGAVGNAHWTGVPLAGVLDAAGPLPEATEVVFRGADHGQVNGFPQAIAFERSLSIADAMQSGALLAFAMNGEPLPARHGYPVRLLVPGKYAVASVKWLTGVTLTDKPFTGFFQATHYVFEWQRAGRLVREPVGSPRVRALITDPATGGEVADGDITVRGVAWSGAAPVARVEVSVAGGDWRPARLAGGAGPRGWQRWELPVQLDTPGQTSIRARATDSAGRTQPARPEWNRLGYGGNFIHQVSVVLR